MLADGSAKPARVHMRDPSFVNLQMLPDMSADNLIADMIAGVAMLDPILGGSTGERTSAPDEETRPAARAVPTPPAAGTRPSTSTRTRP